MQNQSVIHKIWLVRTSLLKKFNDAQAFKLKEGGYVDSFSIEHWLPGTCCTLLQSTSTIQRQAFNLPQPSLSLVWPPLLLGDEVNSLALLPITAITYAALVLHLLNPRCLSGTHAITHAMKNIPLSLHFSP